MKVQGMTFPGGWELIAILFLILLLFGGKKLPGWPAPSVSR
jgi:Sec-independent protein translocase protein TatA